MGSADGTAMREGSTAAAFEKSRLFKYIVITSRACCSNVFVQSRMVLSSS